MAGIVAFPQIVQQALEDFADLFANHAQRQHCGEYLTGLFVASRKTILGISSEFAQTTDQSCLNRYLTTVDWDVQQFNLRRLHLLQQDPETRYHKDGVIPLDNTLIDHHGKTIMDVSWFWDHAEQRYKIAHDYIFASYVCPSGKHYPLDFRRFQTEDLCFCLEQPYKTHTVLCQELIEWTCTQQIPGTFVFDSYFTNAPILNYIHSKKLADDQPRGYVGSLKFNRNVEYQGQRLKVSELATRIAPELRKPLGSKDERQWYFTCTLRLPDVQHKVRLLLLWENRDDPQPRIVLVTNRTYWEVTRIVRVYRQRWTGTETFHRDGKQDLGMGDCQLRGSEGQTRHMYLVMLAYSLLMQQLGHDRSYDWAYRQLTTIGEACRALLKETLRTTLDWAMQHCQNPLWSRERIFAYLNLV